MKYLHPILLVSALSVACSESNDSGKNTPDAATPDSGRSTDNTSTRTDTSTTGDSNASSSNASDSGTSQPTSTSSEPSDLDAGDANVQVPDGEAPDADVSSDARADADADTSTSPTDAGDAAMETLERECSNDPLDTVAWSCSEDAGCSTTPVNQNTCPLPWGCDDYETAIEAAGNDCSPPTVQLLAGEACGYSVIERRIGAGDPQRAFYKQGELIGVWSMTDVVEAEQHCSGVVPEECLDWELNPTNVVDLCPEPSETADASADAG